MTNQNLKLNASLNPKLEILNPKQFLNSNFPNSKLIGLEHWGLEN